MNIVPISQLMNREFYDTLCLYSENQTLPRNVTLRTKRFFGTLVLTKLISETLHRSLEIADADCELRSNISIKIWLRCSGLEAGSLVPNGKGMAMW